MDISKYFTLDSTTLADKDISLYVFDDSLSAEFIDECLVPFRQAYIGDNELEDNIREMGTNRQEEISGILPTKPNLRSGEFGEILSFYLISHIHSNANIKPLKWRWKEHRDMPCHLSDVILLKCDDYNVPHVDDYLVTVEVKNKAAKPSPINSFSSINEAIEGAAKDKTSRFSKTIPYLIEKYKREKDYESAKFVQRFSDSITTSFQKHINAIAIIDKAHYDIHVDNINLALRNSNNDIIVYVLPVDSLKSKYEQIFDNIPNT